MSRPAAVSLERDSQGHPSDADVVAQVLAGDREAFSLLVDRYQDEFTAYARRMTGSVDDAADIVQDSFVRAYSSLARCRDPAKFKGWLFRIVTNQCKTHLSKRSRRKTWPMSSVKPLAVPAEGTPQDEAEARDMRRKLHEALRALTDEQREALILKYLHGLSLDEIAELLSATVPAVKMRLKRGREALRAQLDGVMI